MAEAPTGRPRRLHKSGFLVRLVKKLISGQDEEKEERRGSDAEKGEEQPRHSKGGGIPWRGVLSVIGGFLVQLTLGSYYR